MLGFAAMLLGLVALGCAPSNLADVLEKQSASMRSSYGRVTTIYGSAVVCGTGAVNVSVSCTGDGMTIRALDPIAPSSAR